MNKKGAATKLTLNASIPIYGLILSSFFPLCLLWRLFFLFAWPTSHWHSLMHERLLVIQAFPTPTGTPHTHAHACKLGPDDETAAFTSTFLTMRPMSDTRTLGRR